MAIFGSIAGSAYAQSWQTYFELEAQTARTVLIDPTSVNTTQPALFLGQIGSQLGSVLHLDSGAASFEVSDSDPVTADQLGYDSYSGLLYSVGLGPTGWVVRESHDAGQTWTNSAIPPLSGWASGFATDGAGEVFVCGRADDPSGTSHWIVVRRDSTGAWAIVRDWTVPKKNYAASKMCIRNGYLYVVGRGADQWVVQRGQNLTAASIAWDSPFVWAPKGSTAGAVGVTCGSDGAVYVFGVTGGGEISPTKIVLQRSLDFGATWLTIATFADSTVSNRADDLAFDSNGNLHLVGAAVLGPRSGPLAYKWVVHTLNANGVWQTPWFPLGNSSSVDGYSEAKGISTDALGNVFVAGFAHDSLGNVFSIVQRFSW
jgi:hypothetical protein